jgi:hypothetical protein
MTAVASVGGQRPFILRKGIAKLSDLADGMGGYPGDYPGRVYFVNNITGLSTNDGLSWASPFAEISQAISASETFRALPSGTTNDYVRNVIYVQGTGTAYTALDALPNYCDIIGIGADPRGNGTGIASVTASTGTDTVDSTGVRGLGLYNLQFTGSGTGYSLDLAVCFRSIFENCAFVNKSTGSVRILTGGGITIRNCHMGGDTVTPTTGLTVGNSGGNFNQCLVEANMIYGATTGIANSAYLCDGTLFRWNSVYGGTTGISDTSTESTIAGNAFYMNNYVIGGTNAFVVSNNGTARSAGNHTVSSTTGAMYQTSS